MFFKMTIVLQRAETFNILQRAETFNMKSSILKIKTHFINQYEINCIQENCYVCALV